MESSIAQEDCVAERHDDRSQHSKRPSWRIQSRHHVVTNTGSHGASAELTSLLAQAGDPASGTPLLLSSVLAGGKTRLCLSYFCSRPRQFEPGAGFVREPFLAEVKPLSCTHRQAQKKREIARRF